MKLKMKHALEMAYALGQLDSHGDGEARTLYKFDGPTRLLLARARRRLREIEEDYRTARNALLLEVTEGTGELPVLNGHFANPEDRRKAVTVNMAFVDADRKLLEAETELDIRPVSAAQLNLDANPIPVTVLDLMGALLEE